MEKIAALFYDCQMAENGSEVGADIRVRKVLSTDLKNFSVCLFKSYRFFSQLI